MLRTVSSVFVVRVDDRFGVTVGIKAMAATFEFFFEFSIVVNLAVVDDPRRSIRVVNRLLSALQINDGQPPHGQPNAVVEIKTILIRTSMPDRVVHSRKDVAINLRVITANDTCYSTHANLQLKSPAARTFHLPQKDRFAGDYLSNMTFESCWP